VAGQLPLVQELPGPGPPGRVDRGEEDAGDGGDDQEDDEQRDQDQSHHVALPIFFDSLISLGTTILVRLRPAAEDTDGCLLCLRTVEPRVPSPGRVHKTRAVGGAQNYFFILMS